jgi:baseplate J-like protein
MDAICQNDPRRDAVRRLAGRNGLDYVEVASDQPTLYVYFLGKLPAELRNNRPGLEAFLRIDGGERITGLRVVDVDPHVDPDPERDDYLVVELDRRGDFSCYTLRLVGVAGIDPHYDRAAFSFAIDCPSDLDCKPVRSCPPPALDEPRINYLVKDYASFRQLIFDRLAVLAPAWTERHVPDLGVTLVEILAYVGDYLSYYQDAVATEAYLGTARQRISVRRHTRLVDFQLHEGCNARAWVAITTSVDVDLPAPSVAFATGSDAPTPQPTIVSADGLAAVATGSYEYFEPMLDAATLRLRVAHNEIRFYTWGRRECCVPRGATCASLLDGWRADPTAPSGRARALLLQPGDVVIFEEVLGPVTGVSADADPRRRHAVRLTEVQALEDPVYPIGAGDAQLPTPVLQIRWAADDALPFPLCLSTIGAAPGCVFLDNVSVARGNIARVDHGRTVEDPELPAVPVTVVSGPCECAGQPADVTIRAGRYRPTLQQTPITFHDPTPVSMVPAARALVQDVRAAIPAITLTDSTGAAWSAVCDLLSAGPGDHAFVAEIDNDGIAHLRFGDGELGRAPTAGSTFPARYRVGNGAQGNVGAEAISRLVLRDTTLHGVSISVRNPLPAQGGTDPEPIAEAKQLAPRAFRKQLERAITADDYATLAAENPALQRAAARLVWNGSWNEAEVPVDPLGGQPPDAALIDTLTGFLFRFRRIGHDLRVVPAVLVPIKLTLDVCVRAGYDRGHVEAALRARFISPPGTAGTAAFFDPDNLSFGDAILLSPIVAAAQMVTGVACATVTELRRLFEPSNHELETGVLPLGAQEIAQLDNDPDHPERGQLTLVMRGGR